MKNIFSILLIGVFLSTALVSCDKIKNRSKKLQRQPLSGNIYWSVKSLTINGVESDIKGSWVVSQDYIYDTIQTFTWSGNPAFGESTFEWQFQDRAKIIQLNHRLYCAECDGIFLDSMDYFSNAITGTYTVEKQSRKKMIFKSNSTVGFSGQEVIIEIEGKKK